MVLQETNDARQIMREGGPVIVNLLYGA
jgi:hypothetical protein